MLALELITARHIQVVAQAVLNLPLRILPFNLGAASQACSGQRSCGLKSEHSLRRLVHIPTWLGSWPLARVLPHLSFIKIDVDSMNPDILETLATLPTGGAASTDPRYRPVIKVEWFARASGCSGSGADAPRLWATASSLNYTVYGADGVTAFPTCEAAVAHARRVGAHAANMAAYGGDALYSDLILFPAGVTFATRHQFCPEQLPHLVRDGLPTLPIPP